MENLLRTSAPYFRDSNTIIEEMMINGSLITNSEQVITFSKFNVDYVKIYIFLNATV